ncbi:MAG TPA: flagellar biosynthetic protein FliR [Kineosporiaceae bacterium]|nr:flagellar biosynthetic protein FliR [Kineosporiaceae bacterium]
MSGLQVAIGESTLAAYLLALARTAGFVLVSPPFNTRTIPAQVKAGVAMALALPLTGAMAAGSPDLTSRALLLQMVAQVVMGLALGFFVLAVVVLLQTVGDIFDAVGGFQMSMSLDPLLLVQTSVLGRLYQLLAVTLLFATDGHLLVLQGLARSAGAMPVPVLSWNQVAQVVTADVAGVMAGAVEIAAPVMATMLVADVALGLMSRAAPALNAFTLGFPLKIAFTLLLVALMVARVPDALARLVEQAVELGLNLSGG